MMAPCADAGGSARRAPNQVQIEKQGVTNFRAILGAWLGKHDVGDEAQERGETKCDDE
jgi:hypothetical protein